MSIAAAAAVMASGLIVGGSSASLAFAEPEKPAAGDGTDVGTGGPAGPTPGQPGGAQGESPVVPSTKPDSTTKDGTVDRSQQPQSRVGNGRTGLEIGNPGSTPGNTPSSKQPEPPAVPSPPASSGNPGELPSGAEEELHEEGDGEAQPDENRNLEDADPDEGSGNGSESLRIGGGPNALRIDPDVPGLPGAGEQGTPRIVIDIGPPRGGTKEDGTEENGTNADGTNEDGTKEDDGEGGEEGEEEHDWCWWPFPTTPQLPGSTGGGGGGANGALPQFSVGQTLKIPQMQLPQMQLPQAQLPLVSPGLITSLTQPVQPLIDVVAGLATAATELPFTTVTLPVIVIPGGAPGGVPGGGTGGAPGSGAGGVGGPGGGPRPGMPESPRVTGKPGGKPASPPDSTQGSPNVPAYTAGAGAAPAPSYRAGYTDYLRAAGLGEVAAIAVPGVTGILALVGAGGLLGYRQARAGHTVRASGTGRFMS